MIGKFIVYACPTGLLAEQVCTYFRAAHTAFGHNPAHDYMPHCTLTGFFHDKRSALPVYHEALATSLERLRAGRPRPTVRVTGLLFREDFHGLTLDSPWLKALVADFARRAHSPSRGEPLRLKDWLHLSFAYDFVPEHGPGLERLARELIDPFAPAGWELRLYERTAGGWEAHATWPFS